MVWTVTQCHFKIIVESQTLSYGIMKYEKFPVFYEDMAVIFPIISYIFDKDNSYIFLYLKKSY